MKLSAIALACAGAIAAMTAMAWSAAAPSIGASLASRQVGYEIYQVCSGDTIDNIASRYGVTAESIRSVNNLSPSAEVAPGQSLAIVMPTRPQIFVPKERTQTPPLQDPEATGDAGDGPASRQVRPRIGAWLDLDCG